MDGQKVVTSTSYDRHEINTLLPKRSAPVYSSPHSNVALICHDSGDHVTVAVCHSKILKKEIDDYLEAGICLTFEFRKRLLLQITHGLNHLHEHRMTHGTVNEKNVLLSPEPTGPFAVLVCFKKTGDIELIGKGENFDDKSRKDVKDLADVFEYVLSNGWGFEALDGTCRDHVIARTLIKDMREEPRFSTPNILKHPFFWTEDKKINFLMRSADLFKMHRGAKMKFIERSNERDWTKSLVLTDSELDTCRSRPNSKDFAFKNAVEEYAKDEFEEHSRRKYFSLLKFFRNTRTHFHEQQGDSVKKSFQNDETTIYWQFFSKRYPNLLDDVYRTIKSHNLHLLKGIQDIYFDAECENAPLPGDISKFEVDIEVYEAELAPPELGRN